ncbi:hypothetical protein [Arthrobacter glacialis]|uniref:hypothetical protein n=1 Tax=Arthrobacter glacialis TaxID=1664 RepID=UPI000CD3B222|nr:hypothetical protein [Arthrobacter glacialis]POH58924.1 hypothetical protein CVS28_09460 [Arthrobacter glacialis]
MRLDHGIGWSLDGFDLSGTDPAGVRWLVEDVENWDSPPSSTGAVNQNEFADGGRVEPTFLESHPMVIKGYLLAAGFPLLTGRALAKAAAAAFKAAIPVRQTAPLVLSDGGVVCHRMVQQEGKPDVRMVSNYQFDISVQIVAPDPRKLGGDGSTPYQHQQSAFLPSTTGGLQLPGPSVVRTNLCTNPQAKNLTGYDAANGATNGLVANDGVVGVGTGLTSIKTTLPTYAGDTGANIHSSSVAPGVQRTFSIWVKTSIAGVRVSIQGSGTVANVESPGHTGDGTWQRLTVTATGATTGSYTAYILKTGSTAGQFFQFTGLLVEDVPAAGTYFDGDTPAVSGASYSWSGAADLSPSLATRSGGVSAPFSIGATVVNGSVTIDTIGDAPPPVLVRIDGPAVQPIIRDSDGGSMPLDITLDAGQWLDVDMDARTVKFNSAVNRRNLLRGPWITPHSGMVLSLDAAVYDPLTSMTVFWTDASY